MQMTRRMWLPLLSLTIAVVALGCAGAAAPEVSPAPAWQPAPSATPLDTPLKVGMARVDISPSEPTILGGYGIYGGNLRNCRWSNGVHDPLYATAIYFERGADKLGVVTYDLVGVVKPDIDEIRERAAHALGTTRERIIVSASHTHHAPDTVGLWGTIFPPQPGRDEGYMTKVRDAGVEALATAMAKAEPATLSVAVGEEANLHTNIRRADDPDAPVDDTLTVLVVRSTGGKALGTVVNWGCHPTTEDETNHLTSADWVYYLRETMDKYYPGGVPMFINGSVGGAIQPSEAWRDAHVGAKPAHFAWAEAFGTTLGEKAAALAGAARLVRFDRIEVRYSDIQAQNDNVAYTLGHSLGMLDGNMPGWHGMYETEVTAVRMGDQRWGSMPGEMMPDLGDRIRERLGGRAQVLVGLGQDWLGYIVDEKYYHDSRYAYEKMLCLGPQFGPHVVRAYGSLAFE